MTRSTRRPSARHLGAAALALAAASAVAGDFDGSRRLLCATVEARDCMPGDDCFRGLADDIGAPNFMRIDFEKKVIAGTRHTTPITFLEKTDRQVLMQGTEIGYAWAVALEPTTGRFSASLTNVDGTFVLFGSCTPL